MCRVHTETEVMYYKGQVVTYTDEKPTMVEEDFDYREQRNMEKLWTKCYGGVAAYLGAWYCGTWYYGEGGSLRGSMVWRRSKVYKKTIVVMYMILSSC